MLPTTRKPRRAVVVSLGILVGGWLVLAPRPVALGQGPGPELDAALRSAQTLYGQGKFAEAEAAARSALRQADDGFGPRHPYSGMARNLLGTILASNAKAREALPLLEDALEIFQNQGGPGLPAAFQTMENLGRTQLGLEDLDGAERTFKRLRDEAGEGSTEQANGFGGLADVAIRRERPAEAVPLAERALKIVEAKHPRGSPEAIRLVIALAKAYSANRQHDQVVSLCESTLKAMEARGAGDDPATADLRGYLGMAATALTRWELAETQLKRALATATRHYGPNHRQTAAITNALANYQQARGRPEEARKLLEQAGSEITPEGGGQAADLPANLINRAGALINAGRHAQAESLLDQALKTLEAQGDGKDPLMAKALNAKATLYQATGRRPQSVELLERALKISEDWNGPDHFDTAMIAYNLGTSLFYMNRREEAIRLLQRALVVFEAREKTGSDGRLAVAARNALAGAIEAVGDKDAALQLARRTVAEAEARLGADHPELAVPLNNLATMLTSAGRYDEAEPHARRALKIIEDRYGRDHPIAAPIINGIANIEVARRRYDQAEASSLRAVTIARNALSVEHPDTAKFMENHATILFDRGKPADALPVFDESRRIRRKLMGRTLPVLAEEHSLSVLQGDERSAIDYALTRALLMWEDPQWAETSAGWVLNAKSLTLRAFAERAVLARDARTPAAKEALRTLDETRLKLASLTFQTAPTDSEAFLARQREVEALVQRERRESTALGRALNLPDHEPWVEIQRVRQKLPPDALLIEFARYHQLAPGTDGLKPDEKNWSYAVWVIPSAGQGRVKVVDLGPAAPIEQAVANLTAKLKYDERVYLEEGEVGYEARCLPALREVARRVLDPILPELAAVKRWAISPDGALWLIPWPALPVAENVYAVERHLIHLVATGRDLVEPKPQGPGTSAPVVFADPSYDLSPTGGTTAPAQPGAAESPTSEDVNAYLTRAIDLGGTYPRLVFSEREAREVAPRMSAYAKAPTKVFQLDEATEANFKRLQRPRALLLSTHGAYREKPLNATDPAVLAMPDNPLLRCWLVLAGGNKHAEWFESNRGSGNDGLLTGLEVLGTDLRGTELVVLSACETAQGRTFEGEGVSGLRQAFHLAGARTVLGTLWSVGDLPATQMTINFFERLNLDHDPATALRGAQLAMINHHRKAGGAAHPYRWAMFAMTGDPGDGWAHDPVPEDPGGPPILTDDAKEGGPTRGGDLHTDTDHIAQATTADGEPPAGRYLFGLSGPGRPARGHPWIEGALFTAILAGSLYSARWWLRGASPGV